MIGNVRCAEDRFDFIKRCSSTHTTLPHGLSVHSFLSLRECMFITTLIQPCHSMSHCCVRVLLGFLFSQSTHASVLFSTLFLMDSSAFSAKTFSSLVFNLTNATSLTLQSVESDTITGVQGKRIFAEGNPRPFYDFQILHVTRVRSSIEVEDEMTASAIIRFSLPHQAFLRGLGVAGIDGSVEIGEAGTRWQQLFTATYLDLPPFVAQYLILGWVLTVMGFVSCVVCYCCCCTRREVEIPRAAVVSPVVIPLDVVLDSKNKTSIPEKTQKKVNLSDQNSDSNNTQSTEQAKPSTSVSSDPPPRVIQRPIATVSKSVPPPPPVTPPMLAYTPSSSVGKKSYEIEKMRHLLRQLSKNRFPDSQRRAGE